MASTLRLLRAAPRAAPRPPVDDDGENSHLLRATSIRRQHQQFLAIGEDVVAHPCEPLDEHIPKERIAPRDIEARPLREARGHHVTRPSIEKLAAVLGPP